MSDVKKVSVIMPVYNGMPLIQASIDSLINQSYKNWECIIIDDGSNDGTSKFLDSISDQRFKIIHFPKNMGRPIARQKGLDEACGEYLAMLDAEDLYHPQKLEMQVDILERYLDVDLVCSNMCSFGTRTNILYKRDIKKNDIYDFDGSHFPCHATSMLRTSKAKKFRYDPKMKLGQDQDFLEKYLAKSKFLEMSNILYYYSELDSVNLKKIRRTYKLNILKYFGNKDVKKTIIFFLKYLYSIFIYPFLDIDTILKKRGVILTDLEILDYDMNCNSVVMKYRNKRQKL